MKNVLGYIGCLLLVGCDASQVVEFPETDGSTVSTGTGSSGGQGGSSVTSTVTTTGVGGSTSVASTGVGGDPCDDVCCPDGQECVDGECITPDLCTDVDCCEGETCFDGECVPEDPCGGQCSEGEQCVYGHCVCNGDDEPDNGCGSGKTLLCHHAAWHNHNICVGNPAVPAHLAHGDSLGDCSSCGW